MTPRTKRVLSAVSAVLVALVALIAAITGGDSSPPPAPPAPPAPTSTPAPDAARSATAPAGEFVDGLRGPDDQSIGSGAPAGGRMAPWPGCLRKPIHSYSARTSSVRAIALHITVSRNRPGRGDMDQLTAYGNNSANGVSWHFLIDNEGHCNYSVPVSAKAWAIAGLNSQTVNIENIAYGDEHPRGVFAGRGAGKLSRVVRRIAATYHIPLRLGATDGHCNVTRPGIIAHWMGGSCAGGHNDIRPWWIRAVVRRIAHDARAAV